MKKLIYSIIAIMVIASPCMAQDFDKNAINVVGYQAAQTTTSYVIAPSVATIFPATAGTIEVASSSTNDTADVTILVSGLNAAWQEVSETVALDGTTGAVTVNSYIRVNKLRMSTVGITGVAVGVIKAYLGSDIYCSIAVGQTESQNAFYSVPVGKFAVLKSWSYSALTQPAVFQLKVMAFGGKVTIIDRANITLNSQNKSLDYPVTIPPKSDVAIYANSTASTAIVAGSFQLQLKQ